MRKAAQERGKTVKSPLLPHCTWDKFGDLLAQNGGKIYGLFDELISFFSSMNMYSASKSAVQDNREYQDFLQLFTGKAKNRETSKYIESPLYMLGSHMLYKHIYSFTSNNFKK